MREIIPIKEALEQTLKRLGLGKGLEENRAVEIYGDAVGKKIADKSKAIKIIKGTLYVKAQSPAWSHQLSLMREQIKQQINNELGKDTVKEIRFRC